jgi:phosphohistidine phosphatase
MRRLLLTRHAKSDWDSDAPDDHARPLNKRGRRDAPRMGALVQALGWRPQLVLCSSALRALETLSGLRGAWEVQPEVRILPSLYHGGAEEARAALATVPEETETVMLIGHNPGLEEALLALSGARERLPTAAVASLEAEGAEGWASLADRDAAFVPRRVLRPRVDLG